MPLRYKDQESLKTHGSSGPFTAFQKKLGERDLMRAPMTLKIVSEQGGFGERSEHKPAIAGGSTKL